MSTRGSRTFHSNESFKKMCKLESLDEDLQALDLMHKQGMPISQRAFYNLLQACMNKKDLAMVRRVHSLMISHGLDSVATVCDQLIQLFAACGSLQEASLVFEIIATPSVYTWFAIISAHVNLGKSDSALALYTKMQQEGIKANKLLFACVLKACSNIGSIGQGKLIHDQIARSELLSDVIVGSTLVNMYGKCGCLEEACKVFEALPNRNVVSWGAMLGGYVQRGQGLAALELSKTMQNDRINSTEAIILCSLKACANIGALGQGRLIHDQVIISGLDSDGAIGNSLVHLYAKCQKLGEAHGVFDGLPNQSVVSWNALMVGYVQQGHGCAALELWERMLQERTMPSKVTYSCVLKACSIIGALEQGKLIHNQALRRGFQSDVGVGNALIDMYAKCGNLEEAQDVFDSLPNQDVVSWGAMIAGYSRHGDGLSALKLFELMHQRGMKPNDVTILCALKACASVKAEGQGKLIHDQVIRNGLESDTVLGSSLLDMYVKCGNLEEAQIVFDELLVKDVISWGAIIGGYVHHGFGHPALQLFEQMQQEGILPDVVTYSCILQACGSVGAMGQGKQIHDQIIRSNLESDDTIRTSLVEMYMKCGNLGEALKVFKEMPSQSVVSWCAMIVGYVHHGHYGLANECLKEMKNRGLKPASSICTSILAALCHTSHVDEAHDYFRSMGDDYGVTQHLEHFNYMVDLLGSAGHLREAEELIHNMPVAHDNTVWMSLLTACRKYGNVALGEQCFEQMVHSSQWEKNNAILYVLMSDIYANAQMSEKVQAIQKQKILTGSWKKPGKAWIEISSKIHEFTVGDETHSHSLKMNDNTYQLGILMKEAGYVPQLDLIVEHVLEKYNKRC